MKSFPAPFPVFKAPSTALGLSAEHEALVPFHHRAVMHGQGVTRWPSSPSAQGSPGALAFLTPLGTPLYLPRGVPRAALRPLVPSEPSPARVQLAEILSVLLRTDPFTKLMPLVLTSHAPMLHARGSLPPCAPCPRRVGLHLLSAPLLLGPGSPLGLTPQGRAVGPPGHPE